MRAYCGAKQADREEGKTPALNAQRMQRAYIGRVQRTCAHACMLISRLHPNTRDSKQSDL